MLQIELVDHADWPADIDWPALARRAASAAIEVSPHGDLLREPFALEVSVKLSSDEDVRRLNASYREKNKPTNVLSFPLVQKDMLATIANTDDGEVLLGDIVMARETCVAEAAEKDIGLDDHMSHLVVHATLHLLGYDHEDENDAILMEELEVRALAGIGIANPYADSAGNAAAAVGKS